MHSPIEERRHKVDGALNVLQTMKRTYICNTDFTGLVGVLLQMKWTEMNEYECVEYEMLKGSALGINEVDRNE